MHCGMHYLYLNWSLSRGSSVSPWNLKKPIASVSAWATSVPYFPTID